MKKNKYLTLLFLIVFLPNLSAQVTHTVNFSFEELILSEITGEDSNTYTKVEYDELQLTDAIGNPELPVKFINLIIPIDQKVREVNFQLTGQETINISNLVYPSQPPIPTLIGFEGNEFVGPDPEVYSSENPYPYELARTAADGYFDGRNHIVTIAVYPVQYMPQLNQLVFSYTIEITLEMESTDAPTLNVHTRTISNQALYDNILEAIVDNSQDIPT